VALGNFKKIIDQSAYYVSVADTLFGLQIGLSRQNYGTRIARIGRIVTDLNVVLSVLIRMIRLIRVPFLVVASLRYPLRIDRFKSWNCLSGSNDRDRSILFYNPLGLRTRCINMRTDYGRRWGTMMVNSELEVIDKFSLCTMRFSSIINIANVCNGKDYHERYYYFCAR
jgi:hypothetical protein